MKRKSFVKCLTSFRRNLRLKKGLKSGKKEKTTSCTVIVAPMSGLAVNNHKLRVGAIVYDTFASYLNREGK